MLNSEREAILDALEQEEKELSLGQGDVVDAHETLPRIVVTGNRLRELSTHSLSALKRANQSPTLFVRSGELVHIVTDESGRCTIKTSDPAHLRGRMERSADYVRLTKRGEQPTAPPRDVVSDVLALDSEEWPFFPLEALVETPILRPDGTVLSTPGYDKLTRVFYAPAPGLIVPRISVAPTSADVEQAVAWLDEVLGDFPYSTLR